MRAAGWWLADLASQLLDPEERNAVRGDLTESGTSGACALREILGLVIRRQAALWIDWRPWLVLLGIVVPIGILLSYTTRWWADSSAIYLSMYISIWEWSDLGYPGWRRDLFILIWSTTISGAALIGWSWTSGYVMGSLSRRTLWLMAALFCVIVLLGTFGTTTGARQGNGILSGHFWGVVFLRLTRVLLVLLPALAGVRRSLAGAAPSVRAALIGTGVIAILTVMALPRSPLNLVMLWPTVGILLWTLWRRAHISSLLS